MSKWRITGLLLLLLGGASISSAQHDQAGSTDKVRFVQPYLWLGYVRQDQPVAFTFEIKNDTDKAVKIVSAEGACRCTSLEGKAPEEIPGHGTGSFKWVFNAARSNGGLESKEIIITTAEGKDLVGKFEAWVGRSSAAPSQPKATTNQ